MHQIFYIDVNEEVNSIIGKIRKSNAKYNILVIAQGALLMQSAVSLKLIKREVDTLGKKVMMIIRDKRAASLAEKIGFPVKKNLEEIKGLNTQVLIEKADTQSAMESGIRKNNSSDLNNVVSKKNRLINLGSDGFVSSEGMIEVKKEISENKKNNYSEENVFDNFFSSVEKKNISAENHGGDAFGNIFAESVEKVQDFSEDSNEKEVSTQGVAKFLWGMVGIIFILILGIGAYFFLPSAQVNVFPLKKNENFSLKLNVIENPDSLNSQGNSINLKTKLIEKEETLSLNFNATGQKGDSNQKARGKITIYNEFSEVSQVLVVTTRFLSDNNKLFRLLETVTVPGMTIKDGKTEPGKIEAAIVADEAGEDFNIKEATFKIPGFQGSAKYDKFYAKLNEETKGGGNSEGSLRVVSKIDIESAKFATEKKLKEQFKEDIKNVLGEENFFLEDAISYEVVDFSVFPEEGSITESFEYQVKMKMKALSFSEKEMTDKITDFIKLKSSEHKVPLEIVSFENNYGNADIDFAKKTIKMEVSVNAKLKSRIDTEKISNSLSGKEREELDDIISNYPEISKVEAIISPDFLSGKFPQYSSKIKVEINND